MTQPEGPAASLRLVGWREWVELPGLGARAFRAKIDTGARTSALHAERIEVVEVDGRRHVRFVMDPGPQGRRPPHVRPIVDERRITPSTGAPEQRFVITVDLALAGEIWPIEVTLTDRSDMRYAMLIGRAALAGRLAVDPSKSYTVGHPSRKRHRRNKAKAKTRSGVKRNATPPGGGQP